MKPLWNEPNKPSIQVLPASNRSNETVSPDSKRSAAAKNKDATFNNPHVHKISVKAVDKTTKKYTLKGNLDHMKTSMVNKATVDAINWAV